VRVGAGLEPCVREGEISFEAARIRSPVMVAASPGIPISGIESAIGKLRQSADLWFMRSDSRKMGMQSILCGFS
jgi:hypothetical protein